MSNERTRAELVKRRASLEEKLAELTAPPEAGVGVGFGKRVGDGTTEAVERISLTLTARSIHASINKIDAVIAKIDEGTYGVCEVCGMSIPKARMDARPASTRCVDCAAT